MPFIVTYADIRVGVYWLDLIFVFILVVCLPVEFSICIGSQHMCLRSHVSKEMFEPEMQSEC
jgi:hypothetical protein